MSEAKDIAMDGEEKQEYGPIPEKFASLAPLLERPGPFARNEEGFEPGSVNFAQLSEGSRILVVGAGGLGCEILKNLALSGFTDIHVIDLDTIDLSNLNRQFLFRMKDVGQPKAKVAAEVIMQRCKGVSVKWHNKPIQSFDSKWYTQFDYVIAGLDNVEARQWLNNMLVDLVEFDEEGDIKWETCRPLIDGGTEGFNGQARVFVPHFSSCFECSIDSMAPARGFAVCTIKNVPRQPEHCIMYAYQMQWPLLESFTSATEYKMYEKKNEADEFQPAAVKLDKDDPHHLTWLTNRAEERAAQFGIKGVTYNLTMQVVKNIIPAIASTNALISAACVNEVVKLKTLAALRCDNFFMYMGGGQTGIYSRTHRYARNPNCPVCHKRLSVRIDRNAPLSELIDKIKAGAGMEVPQSLALGSQFLWQVKFSHTHENLTQPVFTHCKNGALLVATDDTGRTQKVEVHFD